MSKLKISQGIAHEVPEDLYIALNSDNLAVERWENLTPIARNEWICWCVTVKQSKTRKNHIERTVIELKEGKRRPCCWLGCVHRTDKAINPTQKWILEKQTKKT